MSYIQKMRGKMRPIGLHRKSKDYLNTLNIDPYAFEERFIYLESLIKANLAFKTKLENFKQLIDCLSADRCFATQSRGSAQGRNCRNCPRHQGQDYGLRSQAK